MFEVKQAQRTGARLLVQLSGVSGSGKTYTALHLALGLAGGDSKKICLIDTENRRGSLYADCLPDGKKFNVIDFYAPFSPSRYIQAIDAAINAGADVIVIDSVTHEWESEGGCEWIANAGNPKIPNWRLAKAEHKRFVTHMLQSPAHIIACTRAREKTDFSNPKAPINLGVQPIQEKNFSFEATVSLMMQDLGTRQDVLKCPRDLINILGRGQGYIGAEQGAALRAWVDGAVQVDPAIEHWRGIILNSCERGAASLRSAWQSMPTGMSAKLGKAFLEQCKGAANEYDAMRQIDTADADSPTAASDLNAINQAAAAIAQQKPIDKPAYIEPQASPNDDDEDF